jgi:hypothetical protein
MHVQIEIIPAVSNKWVYELPTIWHQNPPYISFIFDVVINQKIISLYSRDKLAGDEPANFLFYKEMFPHQSKEV